MRLVRLMLMASLICAVGFMSLSCSKDPQSTTQTSSVSATVEISTTDTSRLVAYGINNMAGSIDYCLIDGNGVMDSYRLKGFVATSDSTSTGELWSHYISRVPVPSMAELRKLLAEADIENLASEYHGGIADGTQQYLFVELTGGSKIVYFDNLIPPHAQPLLHLLESLRENAMTSGTVTDVTRSQVRESSPFAAFE